MYSDKDRQEFEGFIRDAFRELNAEQPSQILLPGAMREPAEVKIEKKLAGRTWEEIAASVKYYGSDDIAFLSNEAVFYFLPGYMIMCIRYEDKVNMLFGYLLTALDPNASRYGTQEETARYIRSRIQKKQIRAILMFLEFLKEPSGWVSPELEKAKAYWEGELRRA